MVVHITPLRMALVVLLRLMRRPLMLSGLRVWDGWLQVRLQRSVGTIVVIVVVAVMPLWVAVVLLLLKRRLYMNASHRHRVRRLHILRGWLRWRRKQLAMKCPIGV